ncbi:unnamed protein product [Durusdinium trenchii]|uniref:Uncharacterized protein n=2 Tax=Durusdinium trenchii TaxID=1381693 RepID=A0ABP0LTI7_9DINO
MGTDIGANRGQQPVPWFGPLDGPVGRVSESERLRRRLEHTRREIAQRDRQLALLPDRRSQDGFVRCVGQTCFPGEDAEGMKADLAECKKHCQDQAYGAFVVQGDGRAYFKRQKVGDCRRNLEPEAFSTTYLHYSVEVAKLCSDLQHAAAAQQRWSRPTAGPSAFAASAAEARLRRTAQQCMELTRNVQALEEALQHQLEATDERVDQILTALRAAVSQFKSRSSSAG